MSQSNPPGASYPSQMWQNFVIALMWVSIWILFSFWTGVGQGLVLLLSKRFSTQAGCALRFICFRMCNAGIETSLGTQTESLTWKHQGWCVAILAWISWRDEGGKTPEWWNQGDGRARNHSEEEKKWWRQIVTETRSDFKHLLYQSSSSIALWEGLGTRELSEEWWWMI